MTARAAAGAAVWGALAGALLAPAALGAQEPQCTTVFPSATQACNAAVDAIRTFHPLAGMLVSGGNPVLGGAGSLGGLGHVSLTTRVNLLTAALPNPDSATQSSVPASFSGLVPAPVLEAGLGLARGMSGGLLGVDLLASAVLLPTGVVSGLSADPGAPRVGSVALGLGYGARIGLLSGAFPVPALSASYMRRSVPRLEYGQLPAACCTGEQFEFDTDVHADNYRLEAGWRLPLVDLAAGLGVDHYTSSAHIRFHDAPPTGSVRTVTLDLANTRQVLFADAGLRLAAASLVAEAGYQTGADQRLATNFAGFNPASGHAFGGLGLRFGF